ncbi:MAG: hypothetical protein H0T89_30665 [Deltaproteobacteria bacterium]|nr:hypothetical protein [Deltaproteobacteria bacterium]MDQ3298244.1 hypothetical protein [Myxococcota bacterium]
MLRFISLSTSLALLVLCSTAHAESPFAGDDSNHSIAPHANIGFELLGGADAFSAGVRGHVGVDKAFGSGRVQPSIGIGGTFGLASLSVSDPRALDGRVTIGHADWGPEVQLGARWVDGGIVDTRVFASFAYLYTDLDDRLMLDAIEGVGGTRGMRASIGGNWADRQGRAAVSDLSNEEDAADWLIMLAPQQVEITFERSGGSDRYGVTISYGL